MSRRPDSASLGRLDSATLLPESRPVRSRLPQRSPEPGGRIPFRPHADRAGRATPIEEELVRTPPGRVERSRRGTAQWGRHRLAADSVEALRLVGAFGTVDVEDLAGRFQSVRRLREAIVDLQRAGLLRVERFRRGPRVVNAATLTAAGKRLMERSVDPREAGDETAQCYRAGPARGSQVLHDTAVFRAALLETKAIETLGGHVRRIWPDDHLQRLAWRRMQASKREGATAEAAQSVAAASLRLSVCDGKLTFPDVRIEYELPFPDQGSSDVRFVDVEVATPDYRHSALRAKTSAGFRVYVMNADGSLRSDPAAGGPALAG